MGKIWTGLERRYFNPRPREEGDLSGGESTLTALYFNPRPREEGDEIPAVNKANMEISIHALVKRATIYDKLTEMRAIISIHALVKRATLE